MFLLCSVWKANVISKTNFIKIGQEVCEILQFFVFFSRLPSWILEILKLYWLTMSGGPIGIAVPNLVKIGQPIAKISHYYFFKMAAGTILDF